MTIVRSVPASKLVITKVAALYVVGIWLAAMGWVFGSIQAEAAFLACLLASSLVLLAIANPRNLFHMMWLVSHFVFCVTPSFLIGTSGRDAPIEVASICTVLSYLAIAITGLAGGRGNRDENSQRRVYLRSSLITIAASCAVTILLTATISNLAFYMLFPMSVVSYWMYVGRAGTSASIQAYAILFATFLAYSFFFWDGFGRLLLAGMILVPSIILAYKFKMYWIRFPLVLVASISGVLGTLLRFPDASLSSLIRFALQDSSVAPMSTGQFVIDEAQSFGGRGLSGLIDQYILFAIGPFPRALWETKPNGFGFQYVLDNMSISYAISGHSIAASFVGDHIYYGGFIGGIMSSLLAVAIVCTGYVILSRKEILGGAFSIVLCLFIPTFYWGGMSSFSQRFEVGVLAVLAYAFVLALASATVRASVRSGLRRRAISRQNLPT